MVRGESPRGVSRGNKNCCGNPYFKRREKRFVLVRRVLVDTSIGTNSERRRRDTLGTQWPPCMPVLVIR